MNNKILLRILSVILSVCVVLTVGGCKKNNSTENESSKGTTQGIIEGNGNAVQPSINKDSDTAVIKYTSVNSEGKKEDATKVLTINSSVANEITMGNKLSETVKTDGQKQSFVEKETKKDNISKDQAEEIVKNPENWVEFGYSAYIANTSSQRLITSFIEINGTNSNIALRKNLDCEYSITSGSGVEVYITGLVNIEKYPDEESLIKELNDMKVKLVYTLADDSITDVEDWDKVDKKTMDITFG